jgi:recombination protein RecT
MATQVVPFSVQKMVDENRADILSRLPKYLSAEQFFSLCYAIDRNPSLKQVAQRNPESVLKAILKAADCGLVIGSAYEHCWLIPYGNEVQFQIGWRGLVHQLMRAGAVVKLTAACVYEGDEFQFELGSHERLLHRPSLTDEHRNDPKWLFDKKNIRGAYAVAWLPSGLTTHRWCPRGEIEAARLKSKIPEGPAWTHFYPAMASKTAVRRLAKLIEVCGPTAENKEVWERLGKTIEIDNTQYRKKPVQPDDLPMGKARSASRSGNQAAGNEGTDNHDLELPDSTPSDDDDVLGE